MYIVKAHQLQLILVRLHTKHVDVERFVDLVNLALNTIGNFYKRRDEFSTKTTRDSWKNII